MHANCQIDTPYIGICDETQNPTGNLQQRQRRNAKTGNNKWSTSIEPYIENQAGEKKEGGGGGGKGSRSVTCVFLGIFL